MTGIPVACTLSENALNQRRDELSALKQWVREIRRIPDGFALRFDGSTENVMAVAQVVAQERLCCRFLHFRLTLEPDAGPLWLEVSGPDDTVQFLLAMFGLDQQDCPNVFCSANK